VQLSHCAKIFGESLRELGQKISTIEGGPSKMSLSVFVQSASSLPNVDRFSKSDPMCVVTLQGRQGPCLFVRMNETIQLESSVLCLVLVAWL